jgi:hypothetical protein
MATNPKHLLEILKQEELNKVVFSERQEHIQQLINNVKEWPEIETHAYIYGGTEFRLFNKSIGHVHSNGMLDLPFVKHLRKVLLEKNLVQIHHVHSTINWVSYLIENPEKTKEAEHFLLLSYCIKGSEYFDKFPESYCFIQSNFFESPLTATIFGDDILNTIPNFHRNESE